MSQHTHNSSAYRPDIDGLRAIAVFGVIIYHLELAAPGGFYGVDVFFVISGYLITRLILRDLKLQCFSFVGFWKRRIRRIIPALCFMVSVVILAGYFLFLPLEYRSLASSALMLTALSSNIYFFRNTGSYFSGQAEEMPLLHTWSISLEEQFYLIYPLTLYLLYRMGKQKLVTSALVCVTLVSFGLALEQTPLSAHTKFFFLPSRLWELTAGGLVAFIPSCRFTTLRSSLNILGVSLILTSFGYADGIEGLPIPLTLIPVVATAALIYAGNQHPESNTPLLTQRILSSQPLIILGLLSYSLYLWHWPIIALYNYLGIESNFYWRNAIILILTLILSAVSYYCVEHPLRYGTYFQSRKRILTFGVVCVFSLIATALYIRVSDGVPKRLSPPTLALDAARYDYDLIVDHTEADVPYGLTKFGPVSSLPSVFVWGDSHAMSILPAISRVGVEAGRSGLAAMRSSTPPFGSHLWLGPTQRQFNTAVMDYLRSYQARETIGNIILAAVWSDYRGSPAAAFESNFALKQTILELEYYGYSVAVVQQVPVWNGNIAKNSVLESMLKADLYDNQVRRGNKKRSLEQADWILGSLSPSTRSLNPRDYLRNDDGRFRYRDDGGLLYRDAHHLSRYGAMQLLPLFNYLRDWD